jgi:hypothetical protein
MYRHPDFADGSADMLRTRAATANRIRLRALSAYTAGASHSTVVSNTLGVVSLTAADITSREGAGGVREHVLAAKSITLSAAHSSATVYWAITDEADSKVLLAASGTADASSLASGGKLNSPSFVFAETE